MKCPACGRCPFAGGVCEDRVNRGRRYFLMGALALPVARKLEAPAPVVMARRYHVRRLTSTGRYFFYGSVSSFWIAT